MSFTNYQIILVDATMIMGLLILVAVVQESALRSIENPADSLSASLANFLSLIILFALSAVISARNESKNNFEEKITSKRGFQMMTWGFGYVLVSLTIQFAANFVSLFI